MTAIHPPRVPLVDGKGNVTREWYAFFAGLGRDVDAGVTAGAGLDQSGTTIFIEPGGVTNAMLRDGLPCSVIGRYQNSTGDVADIQATGDDRILGRFGGQLEFRAISLIGASVSDGDKGDVVVSGLGTVWTIDNNVVGNTKLADIATDTLMGRDTAGTGDPEAISVTGGIEFSGAGSIRTSAFTGDATKAAGGTALTLATVNANVGTFGSATQAPQFTVNGKGLITAAANVTITPAASSITSPGALTRTDDTNVTLTLGGSPATALLAATSLTLGWTGQLAVGRGGTGVSALGDITRVNDTNVTLTLGGTPSGSVVTSVSFTLGWSGQLAAGRGGTGVSALGDITRVNDTNVTLTLGGTPTGAVITSTSFTLGWSGTLAVARGGTGGGAASGTLLDNITGFASTGLLARTAAGTYAFRTLTAPAAGITVTNGDGVAGNPTLALANDLAALEALSGTNTIYYRSGADTWSAVTVHDTLGFSSGTLKQAIRGAMVKKSADQTGADYSTGATVAFDAEVYDNGGYHDNVTNNSRLTTLSDDTYVEVGATITFGNVTAGTDMTAIIRRNGSTSYDGTVQMTVDAASASPINLRSGPIPVTGGTDYFELIIFAQTDTSIDIVAARTNFWIKAVG